MSRIGYYNFFFTDILWDQISNEYSKKTDIYNLKGFDLFLKLYSYFFITLLPLLNGFLTINLMKENSFKYQFFEKIDQAVKILIDNFFVEKVCPLSFENNDNPVFFDNIESFFYFFKIYSYYFVNHYNKKKINSNSSIWKSNTAVSKIKNIYDIFYNYFDFFRGYNIFCLGLFTNLPKINPPQDNDKEKIFYSGILKKTELLNVVKFNRHIFNYGNNFDAPYSILKNNKYELNEISFFNTKNLKTTSINEEILNFTLEILLNRSSFLVILLCYFEDQKNLKIHFTINKSNIFQCFIKSNNKNYLFKDIQYEIIAVYPEKDSITINPHNPNLFLKVYDKNLVLQTKAVINHHIFSIDISNSMEIHYKTIIEKIREHIKQLEDDKFYSIFVYCERACIYNNLINICKKDNPDPFSNGNDEKTWEDLTYKNSSLIHFCCLLIERFGLVKEFVLEEPDYYYFKPLYSLPSHIYSLVEYFYYKHQGKFEKITSIVTTPAYININPNSTTTSSYSTYVPTFSAPSNPVNVDRAFGKYGTSDYLIDYKKDEIKDIDLKSSCRDTKEDDPDEFYAPIPCWYEYYMGNNLKNPFYKIDYFLISRLSYNMFFNLKSSTVLFNLFEKKIYPKDHFMYNNLLFCNMSKDVKARISEAVSLLRKKFEDNYKLKTINPLIKDNKVSTDSTKAKKITENYADYFLCRYNNEFDVQMFNFEGHESASFLK